MKNKTTIFFIIITVMLISVACQNNNPHSTQNNKTSEDMNNTVEEWVSICGSNFYNGIAFVKEENQANGSSRAIAIDTSGNRLFVFPEADDVSSNVDFNNCDFRNMSRQNIEYDEYVDKDGEYVWYGNISMNRKGEILYDITDKYYGQLIGNGFMLVKEISTGYQQSETKMGIIDGYGNEIIEISADFAKLCGERFLSPPNSNDDFLDGLAFFSDKKLVVDANQGIYYSNRGSIEEYKNGNLLVHGGRLYTNQGTTFVDYDYNSGHTELALADNLIVSMEYGHKSLNVLITTYDLKGELHNEKNIPNIALDSPKLSYSNGNSALYIKGSDGDYVTLIDEYGNFKFEPIKHNNHISEYTSTIYPKFSDGLLKIATEEYRTIFVNEHGEEILSLPYNTDNIGNCNNKRIVVNKGSECFYINVETGEELTIR